VILYLHWQDLSEIKIREINCSNEYIMLWYDRITTHESFFSSAFTFTLFSLFFKDSDMANDENRIACKYVQHMKPLEVVLTTIE
jgi:hypothetical protein